MRTPESFEKEEVRKYLKSIGAFYCTFTTGGYGRSGTPDIVACIDGKFWGIEVKREGKKPTISQQRRLDEIRYAGGRAIAGTAKVIIAELERWT